MNKAGRLSKKDTQVLSRSWEILSRWTEIEEERNAHDEYLYDMAMSATASLCQFLMEYEKNS